VAAVVSVEGHLVAGTVADERMVGVVDQQRQLRSRGWLGAAHDQPAVGTYFAFPERPVGDLGDIGALSEEVRDRHPVGLGDLRDQRVQGLGKFDGDREPDVGFVARSDDVVVVGP
jgi:hypothetical protein